MTEKIIGEATLELKGQIIKLASMIEHYKIEMERNYKQLNDLHTQIVRTNNLLMNIRKIMSK